MMLDERFKTFDLKGDLFGGVTTAIISLPLALAFGVASGAGAEAGLWGAILVGLFAALFGGSSNLISEPTGPMTVIMTAVLTAMIGRYPDQGVEMAFTVVMMAGVFQILLGSLKLGKYITLMPYSVVSGFMSGIGVILILLQIGPFLGHPIPGGGVIGTVKSLPSLIQTIDYLELGLGVATLFILFGMPKKWKKYVPAQLVALVAITLVSIFFFQDADIRRIGEIPRGLPSITIPTFTADMWTTMVLDAMVLGMLGCVDTLLTALIADNLTRKEHKSNRELIGQGIANIFSGMFGGLPGAGATMGTVVNIQVGSKSPMAGVIRALILLIIVLLAAGLTEPIPLAVLAAIALHVGYNILDWSFLKRVHKVSLSPTLIMYGVMILTVFVDLIVAVGLGVFIANIITIEKLSRVQSKNVKIISDTDDGSILDEDEKSLLDQADGKVLYFFLSGPMIFGVSKAIARQHASIHLYKSMILDLSNVPMMDTSICLSLENAIRDALDAKCEVFIFCPKQKTMDRLQRLGIIDLVHQDHIVQSRKEALEKSLQVVK